MSALEDLSREELIVLARAQAERIAEQDARIAELTDRLARLEHLLSRNRRTRRCRRRATMTRVARRPGPDPVVGRSGRGASSRVRPG
ncbi:MULTISPECIES: hypothetical protein [unclassified Micromonospora]|uniref:hypothetical protein n=1 Tax=unclassified Micromonospora TaxID=2617518 RepID=UPI003A8387E2